MSRAGFGPTRASTALSRSQATALRHASEAFGGLGHGAEKRASLVHGFFPLRRGIGVVDDNAAGLHVETAVLDHRGADRDRGIRIAPPAQPANGTCIDVALERLQLLDDLHSADLLGPADC